MNVYYTTTYAQVSGVNLH